jgi:capsular polysaccharide biosynthesis protein
VAPATFAHEGYADPRHLAAPHRVARRLVTSFARDDRPVYFSRARIAQSASGRGAVVNEAEFEARLQARGVGIVHMQELGLAEQIGVVNGRRRFIGLWGSALHNLMFALRGPDASTFVLIDEARLPANFLLVDSIVGNAAHYLATVRPAGDGRLRIDVEATLAYLSDRGVV